MTPAEWDKVIEDAGTVVRFGTTIVGAIPGLSSALGKLFGGDDDAKISAELAQISEDEKAILRNRTEILDELKAFEGKPRDSSRKCSPRSMTR